MAAWGPNSDASHAQSVSASCPIHRRGPKQQKATSWRSGYGVHVRIVLRLHGSGEAILEFMLAGRQTAYWIPVHRPNFQRTPLQAIALVRDERAR
jgi:hypothetical protein